MLNLKALRLRADLSQNDVALALGVTQGAVSHWEQGSNNPTADVLPALAKLFHCSIDELFGEE